MEIICSEHICYAHECSGQVIIVELLVALNKSYSQIHSMMHVIHIEFLMKMYEMNACKPMLCMVFDFLLLL